MNRESAFPQDPTPHGPVSAEVAVVGVGPAALALSQALAGQGRQVVLVPPVSWTASRLARNMGVALPTPARPYADLCRSLGREVARSWQGLVTRGAEALRARLAASGAGLERGGVLLLAADEAESLEMVEGLADLVEDGFPGRMMGPSAATGYLPVETDFPALYLGGAACFEPVPALSALARQAVASGVRFLAPCPDLEWREQASGVVLEGPGFRVQAQALYLAEEAPLAGRAPWLAEAAVDLLVTDALRSGVTHLTVAASVDRGRETYRSGPGGGLLGRARSSDPESRLRQRFPETRRAGIGERWGTVEQEAADGLPVAGLLPGHSKVHILGAFGPASWSLGWSLGEALALEPAAVAWSRPERLL